MFTFSYSMSMDQTVLYHPHMCLFFSSNFKRKPLIYFWVLSLALHGRLTQGNYFYALLSSFRTSSHPQIMWSVWEVHRVFPKKSKLLQLWHIINLCPWMTNPVYLQICTRVLEALYFVIYTYILYPYPRSPYFFL